MTTPTILEKNPASLFERDCDTDVLLCYQCKKCTLGCPLSSDMDIMPNQVIRLLQLGRIEKLLESRTIWLCSSCQTCTTRCPMGIDIASVMDTLRIVAQETEVESKIPSAPIFINAGLRTIKSLGRLFEAGLALELGLKTGTLTKDIPLAVKMLRAGKLKLLPQVAGYPRKLQYKAKSDPGTNEIAYYPGCSLHASASDYDESVKAVTEALGLKLKEPKGWLCCGSTPAHWNSKELAIELPLKNLSLIESQGHKAVTVPCAMCFSRLKHAEKEVVEDSYKRDGISRKGDYIYSGEVEIEGTVDTIVERIGLEKVAENVKKPLSGLKVVCYYGCLLTRPPVITEAAHPEYPVNMDHLMQTLGADVLDWSYKTDCCGASLSLIDLNKCLTLIQKILDNAKAVGADAIVTACPMCHANLDGRQEELSSREARQYKVPLFYFSQLLALSLGLGSRKASIRGHMVDVRPLLKEHSIIQ